MPLTYTTKHDRVDRVLAADVNRLQGDLALVSRQVFNVQERTYGAVMDGTTDDRTPLLAAIAAADDAGGGTVLVPSGALAFTGQIAIPEYVNLMGMGDGHFSSAATIFKCLDSAAQLRFGAQTTASYGGLSGNFRIDGNNQSPTPLYYGRTLGRTTQNVTVYNAATGGTLVLIEEAQNCRWFGLNLFNGSGDHLTLDRGAAGNNFYALESHTAGESHVRFQATAATVTGLTNYPVNNRFWGGIVEHLTAGATATIYARGGQQNHFYGFQAISDDGLPVILAEVADNAAFTSLSLFDCELGGESTTGAAFDLDDAAVVECVGRIYMNNLEFGYLFRHASARVNFFGGTPIYGTVTTILDPASVTTLDAAVVSFAHTRNYRVRQSATAFVDVSQVQGDAGGRFWTDGNGKHFWGDGASFTSDADLARATGGGLFGTKAIWDNAVTAVKTSNYTALITDRVIPCDCTSGNVTVTLPSAGSPGTIRGHEYTVKRVDGSGNSVIVDGAGSQTIDGALTKTLGSQHASITIYSDQSNWLVKNQMGTIT